MMNLFKTLMRPDQEEDPELTLVAQAANILQVGEFQLLQLAYHEWYGEEMPEAATDAIFQAYMMQGQVPAWARHFARRIIRQDEIGLIDGQDAGYHRYDRNYVTDVPKGVRHFTMACLILAAVMVTALSLGQMAGGKATSVLPPYFQEKELPGEHQQPVRGS